MADKSNVFRNDLLKLIFHGDGIANLADNAGTSPLTNLYAALHTSDPGLGGDQELNEATYTGYDRVPVSRSSAGWTITADTVTPTDPIEFPAGTGGSGTVTHVSIGTHETGAGKILYRGTISPSIVTGDGVTPIITEASTIQET